MSSAVPFTQIHKERLEVLAGTRGDPLDHAVRRRAIAKAIADLGAAALRLEEARQQVLAVRGDLDDLINDVTGEGGTMERISTLEAALNDPGGIVERLGTVEGDLNDAGGIKERLDTAEGSISVQGGRLATAEGTLTTHGDTLTDHEDRIAALETHHPTA